MYYLNVKDDLKSNTKQAINLDSKTNITLVA
jgi:hypothetical protein